MKVKRDFITNSSSASYIITLRTGIDMDLDEFKDEMAAYVNSYISEIAYSSHEGDRMHFWEASDIYKKTKRKFEITEFTSMHNSYEDIPHYMRMLLLNKYIKFHDWDIEVVKFEIDHHS